MSEELKKVTASTEEVNETPKTAKWARIEGLLYAILMSRLDSIDKKAADAGKELLEIQQQMKKLQDLLGQILAQTDPKTGGLDLSKNQELQKLLAEAKELGLTFNNPNDKYVFTKFDRDNLVSNLEGLSKTKQTELNLMAKKMERLFTERNESLKYANSIQKTLDDIKMKIARNLKG